MKKVNEREFNNVFSKIYENDEKLTTLDIITTLEKNGAKISSIDVDEDVEMDMQSLNGLSFSIDEFKNNIQFISSHLKGGSYDLNIDLNGEEVIISIYPSHGKIILKSHDESLELDDLLSKKNEKSGLILD